MAERKFKVKVTIEADFEVVVDDSIFNEELAKGISDGFHQIDYDEDKPATQALVEDVAELFLRTDGDGDKMEPYGEIADADNKYQIEMSRQDKSPYCHGIAIKRTSEDYIEVESEEVKPKESDK